MKAVLMSIKAEWAQKIFCGKKTLEIRKSIPREISVPFRCYVYVSGNDAFDVLDCETGVIRNGNKKVVGSFICNQIDRYVRVGPTGIESEKSRYIFPDNFLQRACMTLQQVKTYGAGKEIYAWNVSDVQRISVPIPLNGFFYYGKCQQYSGGGCTNPPGYCGAEFGSDSCGRRVQKPPQSWCYVEDMEWTYKKP